MNANISQSLSVVIRFTKNRLSSSSDSERIWEIANSNFLITNMTVKSAMKRALSSEQL
jgi:hypothetical protein